MIALCLMVKDEEAIVGRLLKSVAGTVQQAVVMDTGSTDNTKQVISQACEEHGIELFLFEAPWENFGSNRTDLLDEAEIRSDADWLLLLDADMELKGTIDESELTADSYMLRYEGDLDYAQKLLVSTKVPWEYVGATHEYIQGKDTRETSVDFYEKAVILHHEDGSSRSYKHERDIAFLTEKLDPRSIFYLAQTYREMGNAEKAIQLYDIRVDLGGWEEECWYAMYQSALLSQCPEKLLHAFSRRSWRVEPLYRLGNMLRERQSYPAALMMLEQAAQIPHPRYDVLFIERWMYEWAVDFELAICLWWNGDTQRARAINEDLLTRDLPAGVREQVELNLSF